jgi:hypothetical protein
MRFANGSDLQMVSYNTEARKGSVGPRSMRNPMTATDLSIKKVNVSF